MAACKLPAGRGYHTSSTREYGGGQMLAKRSWWSYQSAQYPLTIRISSASIHTIMNGLFPMEWLPWVKIWGKENQNDIDMKSLRIDPPEDFEMTSTSRQEAVNFCEWPNTSNQTLLENFVSDFSCNQRQQCLFSFLQKRKETFFSWSQQCPNSTKYPE